MATLNLRNINTNYCPSMSDASADISPIENKVSSTGIVTPDN